jgi:hypothetical protein
MIRCFYIPGTGKRPAFFFEQFNLFFPKPESSVASKNTASYYFCYFEGIRQFNPRKSYQFLCQDFYPDSAIDVHATDALIKAFKLIGQNND